MKAFCLALGIVGTIPLLAAAQTYSQQPAYSHQQPATRSVIKPVGFGFMHKSGCGCQEPVPTCAAPTCCTPVPPPSVGRCCPKPCLLECLHRGLRSLDCLLPCSLGCHSINCHSSCPSCSTGCEVKSSCGSCCTKSRAHFFAFCKPKCGCCSPCKVGCHTPCNVGCCDAVPMMQMQPPVPMSDDNPFKDDVRPMDPNAPPPGQSTYKPYWKKNNATARSTTPMPTPARLDPYAAAPTVRVKVQPTNTQPKVSAQPVKVASRMPAVVTPEQATVKVAIAQEIETVSLTIDDEPPAPPVGLSTTTVTARPIVQRYDSSIPSNPLR